MTYTWLLFDADGTLFDYDTAEAFALERAFDDTGIPFEARFAAEYRRVNTQIWREFEAGTIDQKTLKTERFQRLFTALGLTLNPAEFSNQYLNRLSQGIFLIDGAEALIKSLHGKFGLAIITNGLKEVQRPRFTRSALNGCFSQIIISDEVGASKPGRRIFDIAFEQMNNPPKQNVLIIGDSLTSDIQGGVNYGIDTCWFNPDGKSNGHSVHPTYRIKTLADLHSILNGN